MIGREAAVDRLPNQADKRQFLRDHDDRDIDEVIHARFSAATGRRVALAELRSWHESLGLMAKVLRDDGITADTSVVVEFHIPQTSKRIDMTLTGYGDNGVKNAVVVELKQWDAAEATSKDAIVVKRLGTPSRRWRWTLSCRSGRRFQAVRQLLVDAGVWMRQQPLEHVLEATRG